MKTTAKTNVAGWLASGLMMVSITVASAAVPPQGSPAASHRAAAYGETPVRKTDNVVLAKRSVVVRHDAKTEAAPAKPSESVKPQAKTNLGRCWKRLMDNLREVRQAHRNCTK